MDQAGGVLNPQADRVSEPHGREALAEVLPEHLEDEASPRHGASCARTRSGSTS